MKNILSILGRIMYKSMGWTYDELPDYWADKSVVIGFPHTTNMDTVRALTYIKISKIPARLLVKAEWFFFPMSIFLNSLGGMPVKRDNPGGFVSNIAGEFEKRDELILALVPEGTRKKVRTVKTGFWYIAKAADVPIICWYLDNLNQKTRWIGCIHPGESLEDDLLKIKSLYKTAGFTIPLGDNNP